jgi:hypothetical protein
MGWYWAITFDNPSPADSSTMIAALSSLGKLTKVQTKTTWILAPKKSVSWVQIRQAIVSNLHPTKGNALYVNLRTGKAFEWGANAGYKWRRVI